MIDLCALCDLGFLCRCLKHYSVLVGHACRESRCMYVYLMTMDGVIALLKKKIKTQKWAEELA